VIPDYLKMVDEAVQEFEREQEGNRPAEKTAIFTQLRELVRDTGKAFVVTSKNGRIQIVREARRMDPSQVVAVWDFRRVRIGTDDWMIGARQDGREIAWRIKGEHER